MGYVAHKVPLLSGSVSGIAPKPAGKAVKRGSTNYPPWSNAVPAGRALRRLGVPVASLDEDRLANAAIDATGLTDFGDPVMCQNVIPFNQPQK
jgi:hypothetical protein